MRDLGPRGTWDWYRVNLSIPFAVESADSPEDAIRIAVSEVGKQIQDSLIRNQRINPQTIRCTNCGEKSEAVLWISEFGLTGIHLSCEVKAKNIGHSESVAVHELGPYLKDIPLQVVSSEAVSEG